MLTVVGCLALFVVPFLEMPSDAEPATSDAIMECPGYRRPGFLFIFAFIAGGSIAFDHPARMLMTSLI
jgi:hypothetical protein